MSPAARALVGSLWAVWGLYWWWSSRDVKRARRREPALSRALHLVPLGIAALLLSARDVPGWLGVRWLPQSALAVWSGAALVVAGLALSVWARRVLGRNWSASVTVKVDHEIVRAGPYRAVRHPIYSGLLLGLAGSALANGEWRGPVAVAIAAAALLRKLRLEERWLAEEFGERYEDYRRRTPALIPGPW